jgi:shikimate kinase
VSGPASAGHVVLVGLPGAGKSTVGPLAAARLGRPFVDLDAELERRAGVSVAEQFARDGEPAFRAAEAALSAELAAAAPAAPAVLAPGGGWAANAPARAALAGAGRTVYLRVPPAVAAARVAGERDRRPLLAGAADPLAAVGALLARRGPLYEAADAVVDADAAPDVVAERVVAAVRAWERPGG